MKSIKQNLVKTNTNLINGQLNNKQTKRRNMNKKEIAKFATLVKRNTQKDAVLECLKRGNEFSIQDAQAAGIADPRRVVNKLRTERGVKISQSPRTLRNGETVKRYSLVSPKGKR